MLSELFAVTHDSPQYNERERQGMFYAESWLLTHFLMTGDPALRVRLGQFTALLRQGQPPVEAFTNAMQTSLPVMETALRRYLARGVFPPIDLSLTSDISAPIKLTTRYMTPVEVYFRLGDELLRIDRLDAAEARFTEAQRFAPASPLPAEGLGLVASERKQHDVALRDLETAIKLGSTSFLAYYLCAEEEYHATADDQDRYTQITKNQAADIRGKLEKSIALMPDFGPSEALFGFFEMVQGDQLADAGQHLQRAIQLEPENLSYLFSLAQFQYRTRHPDAARQTLEPLLWPNVEPKLRADALELKQEIDQHYPADGNN